MSMGTTAPLPIEESHLRRGYCVQRLPSSPLPLDWPIACSVPTLPPAWGPPTMMGGITACAAGDALCGGLLAGPHLQMVTTCGGRCRHAGTADGGTPAAMQMMSAGAMGTGLVIVNGGDGFREGPCVQPGRPPWHIVWRMYI